MNGFCALFPSSEQDRPYDCPFDRCAGSGPLFHTPRRRLTLVKLGRNSRMNQVICASRSLCVMIIHAPQVIRTFPSCASISTRGCRSLNWSLDDASRIRHDNRTGQKIACPKNAHRRPSRRNRVSTWRLFSTTRRFMNVLQPNPTCRTISRCRRHRYTRWCSRWK